MVDGLIIPVIWKDTGVETDVVLVNPFLTKNVLEAELKLEVQSRTVFAGIPVKPIQVIVVGTVTEVG